MQWWILHSSSKSFTSQVNSKRNYRYVFMASERKVHRGAVSDRPQLASLGLKLARRCPIFHGSLPWVQWRVWSSQRKKPTDKRSKHEVSFSFLLYIRRGHISTVLFFLRGACFVLILFLKRTIKQRTEKKNVPPTMSMCFDGDNLLLCRCSIDLNSTAYCIISSAAGD